MKTDDSARKSKTRPGGYHSRGVPGEEGDVRRHMRILKPIIQQQFLRTTWPIKGGLHAESTAAGRAEAAQESGKRAVYVLAREGLEQLETPIFSMGETDDEEAVAVFTDRTKAIRYIQVAGWDETHEPATLSPADLGVWLNEAREEGAQFVAVNLDRSEHMRGEPQQVLMLEPQAEKTSEALFSAVLAEGQFTD